MLSVDGEKVEVLETHAGNSVLMEERFDIHPSWVADSRRGRQDSATIRSQSAEIKYLIYVPSIPRMLDALLDQARYRAALPGMFPGVLGNRPRYHL